MPRTVSTQTIQNTLPPEPLVEQDPPALATTAAPVADKRAVKRGKIIRAGLQACRTLRETLTKDWKTNVNYRVNQPLEATPQSDQVVVPVDWSRTKNKQAQLFFQVPKLNLKARDPKWTPNAPLFGAALNFELEHKIRAYKMMDECLADVINASGVAACLTGYEGQFADQTVPSRDTTTLSQPEAAVAAQQQESVPYEVYSCRYATRLSPGQLLWPTDFTGSDWQLASWLGYDGKISQAQAIRNKWIDAAYEDASVGGDNLDTVNDDNEDGKHPIVGKYIKFSRVFYRMSDLDPAELDPRKIGHMVFVDGKAEPVVDEPLKWQKYVPETGQWLGLTTFPIKVLTLTTISDQSIPPSDSRIGRGQVKELNRSRTQMLQQRDRSQPLRWFDVNLVDDEIAEQMRKGVYQDMIPMNGPGDHAIGEVARAAYPRESATIMEIIEHDLDAAWSSGPNQNAYEAQGDQSATEAKIVQGAFSVQQRYEQAKVLRFFLEVAESIGNLMQMFQTKQEYVAVLGPDRTAKMLPWTSANIAGDYIFEAKPDAALAVDISQERQEKLGAYKLLRRDPLIRPEPIVADVLEAFGYDPSETLGPPPQPPPDKGNFRFSFKGEDTVNPIVLAIILKGDPSISPQDIAAAQKLLQDVGFPPVAALPAKAVSGTPSAPAPPAPPMGGPPGMPPQVPPGTAAAPSPGGPPTNQAVPHPGPVAQVTPLNQRYERE